MTILVKNCDRIPLEELKTPKDGYLVYKDRYWIICEGYALIYRGPYGHNYSPQCNRYKKIVDKTAKFYDKSMEIALVPLAYIKRDERSDYDHYLDEEQRMKISILRGAKMHMPRCQCLLHNACEIKARKSQGYYPNSDQPHRCTRPSTYSIDGANFCTQHAGKMALDYLIQRNGV